MGTADTLVDYDLHWLAMHLEIKGIIPAGVLLSGLGSIKVLPSKNRTIRNGSWTLNITVLPNAYGFRMFDQDSSSVYRFTTSK